VAASEAHRFVSAGSLQWDPASHRSRDCITSSKVEPIGKLVLSDNGFVVVMLESTVSFKFSKSM
jgi:hypothetical protein